MRAVRQFNVVPALPARLQALSELAANLHWTWDSETRALFRSLDPVAWRATGEDPLHVIAAVTATRWQELAADPAVVAATEAAAARLRDAVSSPRWFDQRDPSPLGLVAYFSPEFGISETVQIGRAHV